MRNFIASLVLSLAATCWLQPNMLRCEGSPDYTRAEQLVRRTLRGLTPPTDAAFGFTQTKRRLAHLSIPWKTWQTNPAGTFLLADEASSFYQVDSLQAGKKVYSSFTFCCDTTLAIIGYGETNPEKLTVSDRREFIYNVATLTPVFALKDFLARDPEQAFLRYVEGNIDSVVYKTDEGNIISFAINPDREELISVSVLYCDDFYGDVLSTLTFDEYKRSATGDFRYPARIVEKMLGIEANVTSVTLSDDEFDKARILAMIPPTYAIEADSPTPPTEIARSDYNAQIHMLDLTPADSRVLVVEFKDFLLVTGVPLTPANGELVIKAAQEIAPNKPIRYFVPGHHHPHYLGGMRAFVHKGITVIAMAPDSAYIRQLVSFDHTLEPDSLQLQPSPLKLETFDQEKTISDGELEMRLIDIGKLSNHTDNFLVYYFPKYKLLFQDELGWIPADKPLTPASPRQKGLYEAIMLYKLDVETILQGWPLNRGTKLIFTFDELKRSVEM